MSEKQHIRDLCYSLLFGALSADTDEADRVNLEDVVAIAGKIYPAIMSKCNDVLQLYIQESTKGNVSKYVRFYKLMVVKQNKILYSYLTRLAN